VSSRSSFPSARVRTWRLMKVGVETEVIDGSCRRGG
jgi:hypothetical protein